MVFMRKCEVLVAYMFFLNDHLFLSSYGALEAVAQTHVLIILQGPAWSGGMKGRGAG